MSSSAFSFHYSPTLTSIHDYWKSIALTRWTFVGKVMSLLFNTLYSLVGHSFSSKEQASFKFMVAVTICSDFGAQKNRKIQYHTVLITVTLCYSLKSGRLIHFCWALSSMAVSVALFFALKQRKKERKKLYNRVYTIFLFNRKYEHLNYWIF